MNALTALLCACSLLAVANAADYSEQVAEGVKALYDLALINKASAVALRDAIAGKKAHGRVGSVLVYFSCLGLTRVAFEQVGT